MKLLEQITSMGYDVRINERNIKLTYTGEDVPDKSRMQPLLEELKANKSKIVEELQKGKLLQPVSKAFLVNRLTYGT